MNISSIGNTINSRAGKIMGNIAERRLGKSLEKGYKDPAKFAAAMLVTSIVSKDLVGCFIYTKQSLTNEKIPEEKRGFVAAVDLMNGIVMVGGQFLVGKIIESKLTPKLESKFTGSIKDKFTKVEDLQPNGSKSILSNDNLLDIAKKAAKEKNIEVNVAELEEVVKKVAKVRRDPFITGFGILVTAIATTALTKRTLAPLISTPLAGWFKKKFMDKKKPETTKNRMYYEWSSLTPHAQPKIDKTAFSNFSHK